MYYLIYSLVLFIHSCCISLVIYDLKLKYSDEQKDANVRWVYIQVSFHWEIWEYEFVILLCNPNEAHMSLQTPLDLKHLWKSNRESQNIPFHRKEAAWQQCESHFCTFTRSADIYSTSGHPICRWVCFFIRTHLEKCIITSLAHQWILGSEWVPSCEWVPSEWESKQQNITIIHNTSVHQLI